MARPMTFGDVLEAVDKLPQDEQQVLVSIVNRRLAEHERARVTADIKKARRDFKLGRCRPTTTDELMREILS